MPFKSLAQQRFMYANHPQIAKRWQAEYGNPSSGQGQKRSDGAKDFAGLQPSAKARHSYKRPAREQESMKEGPVRAAAAARAGKMKLAKG